MPVYLAKSAGFCFGVNNAVDRVRELLDAGEAVCTLGPIILLLSPLLETSPTLLTLKKLFLDYLAFVSPLCFPKIIYIFSFTPVHFFSFYTF